MFSEEQKSLYHHHLSSESYCYQIWNKFYPLLKVQKVQFFIKCEECETLRDAFAKAGTGERLSIQINQRRQSIISTVWCNRKATNINRNISEQRFMLKNFPPTLWMELINQYFDYHTSRSKRKTTTLTNT